MTGLALILTVLCVIGSIVGCIFMLGGAMAPQGDTDGYFRPPCAPASRPSW